ncbi:hypothetical protein [Nocardia brevicatena]|nr:hypothetical protein [Nocardia brevicatena]
MTSNSHRIVVLYATEQGSTRDWAAIRAWSATVADTLGLPDAKTDVIRP